MRAHHVRPMQITRLHQKDFESVIWRVMLLLDPSVGPGGDVQCRQEPLPNNAYLAARVTLPAVRFLTAVGPSAKSTAASVLVHRTDRVLMEKKEPRERERIETVLKILKKQAPLTVKQEKFCNDACVERFLKAKGDSVKKAAKQLRAALSWRESIGTDHLIADEFAAELAGGFAYVAGHDDEARPVMVFRIKQDYPKTHSQKSFVRLLVFTLEVAISSMSRFVDQFVILFDASFFRSASAFLNLFMGTLKIISEYYPGRLHKAFVIDPPSLFSYLWKGVRPFVELSAVTAVVSSLDFDDSLEDAAFGSYPTRAASLRFDPAAVTPCTAAACAKVGGSSRFSFTVSHFDSLKPWYLSTTTTAAARAMALPTASPSLVGASPLNARSFSFASPGARSTPRAGFASAHAARSIPSTPCSFPPPKQHRQQQQQAPLQHPRTPRPSFLPSPATLFSFRKEAACRGERERESFLPYLRFHRRPYDEMVYRAKMRPPLGGLISIITPHLKQQQLRRNAINIHHQRMQTLNY
ncbi:random slug protein 5-like isoform X2 [Canna indica]|uniref:Random slug protein 5-like isoform X2 n=1 Tax=Canna indica TaxID=4628 RepID=A0AAQ3JP49_9LILI|nr:random slug protein 5-like isoform X2 [Canna indica]